MAIIENELIGNTLLVTINNPSKRNSMIFGFHDELQSTIKMADNNKEVNALMYRLLAICASAKSNQRFSSFLFIVKANFAKFRLFSYSPKYKSS